MRNFLAWVPLAALSAAVALAPAPAAAGVDFTGSLGSLAAKVTFDVAPGGNLMVTLTNTAASAGNGPADMLTAVFFNGLGNLTPVSAFLTSGNNVINMNGNYTAYQSALPTIANPVGSGTVPDIGGEWGYGVVSGLPNGATAGISSSGLGGWFGQSNFNGPDLANPAALDGVQYGIAPSAQTTGSGNGGIKDSPLINNAATFILSGYSGGVAGLTAIGGVSFQYGTAQDEPNIPGVGQFCANGASNFPICTPQETSVPEPMSAAVLGAGLLGLAALRRRRAA